MTQLVLWLGVCLVATVLALAHVLGQLPDAQTLDRLHLAGMRTGYAMCLGFKESEQEAAKPRLTSGGSL